MKGIIEIGWSDDNIISPTIEISYAEWHSPTDAEWADVPEKFVCFNCGEERLRKDFGGFRWVRKRICKYCYPWVSEWEVGCQVKFLNARGFGGTV